ncbi:ankyrin repeat-containing domain protein [Aspergillus spectabilis]
MTYWGREETGLILHAAWMGSVKVLQMLLETPGVDLLAKDNKGQNALSRAIASSNISAAEVLLADGRIPVDDEDNEARNTLGWAAYTRQIQMIELLEKAGTKLTSLDSHGRTPLCWAGTPEIAPFLLDRSIEPESRDKEGRITLSWIAQHGSPLTLGTLVDRGAEVDSRDHDERTPLFRTLPIARTGDFDFLLK